MQLNAIGFCFGGLCVLDLARYNVGLQSVVSFHGALKPLDPEADHSKLPAITAKVLVLHGEADEHVNVDVPGFLKVSC